MKISRERWRAKEGGEERRGDYHPHVEIFRERERRREKISENLGREEREERERQRRGDNHAHRNFEKGGGREEMKKDNYPHVEISRDR